MADMNAEHGPIPLDHIDHFPDALIGAEPGQILEIFPNPTLITIAGEEERPLWVTTLLHGNETTSFYVLRALADRYRTTPPPRSLTIFVGNVRAMAAGVRHLPDQPDFNRIWAEGSGPYHDLVHQVCEIARQQNPFASIDIHNNSGSNPHYGCVNALRPADLHLATMFADLGVFYRNPPTTQSIAFSNFCPAATVECGTSGDQQGIERAIALVEQALRLDGFPPAPPPPGTVRLYHTLASVVIDPDCSFGFDDPAAGLNLRADLEDFNFSNLPADTLWATASCPQDALRVIDEHGHDLTDEFFTCDGNEIRSTRAVTPAMITHDIDVIRQDCLCYLMEPI